MPNKFIEENFPNGDHRFQKPSKVMIYACVNLESFQIQISYLLLDWNFVVGCLCKNYKFVKQVLFTDEKEFKGDGIHHSFFANVWGGILNEELFGPHFLSASLTSQDYYDVLRKEIPDILRNTPEKERTRVWFMHDGATAHYDKSVKNLLNDNFPNKWIGKGGSVTWIRCS